MRRMGLGTMLLVAGMAVLLSLGQVWAAESGVTDKEVKIAVLTNNHRLSCDFAFSSIG